MALPQLRDRQLKSSPIAANLSKLANLLSQSESYWPRFGRGLLATR